MLALALLHMHEALDEGRHHGTRSLSQQKSRNAHSIKQHRRKGRHHHRKRGIEHGGYSIPLLLGTFWNDLGIDAHPCELINRLKAGNGQRYGKVAHVREGVTKQPQTKKCVRETIDEVTRDEKSLARQAVHNWRDGQRHEDVRNKLYCHDKRRGQGGTRLVKNEERERKGAGNATSSADDRSKGNKREVARLKRGAIVVHGKTSRKKAPSSELGQKQSVV